MKLPARSLTMEMQGADVAMLHRELRQLNFTIPEDEAARSFFGPRTLKAVQDFQRQKGLEPTGAVDERTAAAITIEVSRSQARVVRGTVSNASGAPVARRVVHAFDRDLRREEMLGLATTDADGRYEIKYTARHFRRAEKVSADLVVRVMGRDGRALLSSEVIFNAQPVETVDFILDGAGARGISEYERYLVELRPLLEGEPLSALNERDIIFLEGETGIEGLHLAYLSIAHRHAATTKIASEVFYGLVRQDLPTNLPALFLQRPAQLRRALELSIEQNIIPGRLAGELPRILDALRRQAGQAILRNADDGASSVRRLLRAAGLSDAEQKAFLDSYLQHEGSVEEFWRSLAATPLAPKVAPLQATLQLGLLTRNNAPLVSALHAKGVTSMRDLPRLGRDGLRQLILGSEEILAAIDKEEGETNEQRAARFADGMLEVLRATAPTSFIRAAYEQSSDGVRRGVARVLGNAPELELRDDDVERFLSENPRALAGVADPAPVRRQLKRVQRVLRIAPDAEHAEALMAAGLDSAQAIAGMSPDAFAEQFAERFGGEAQARSYHNKAGRVTGAVAGIVANITQSMQAARPGVVAPVPDSVRELPNFTTLFGSQSFCSCEHCGSVLSPAAYLVDLLQFINPPSGQKPITELRRRRPDIEHIPLTCENTNTPLPYVDLVNEVLEFYVANGQITEEAARDTKGMTAAELSVNPQHVIDDAYTTLAAAVYPPTLPFHRPLAVARLYLGQLGSSRHELMQTFRRNGQPTTADIDLEHLNLSVFERDILTGESGRPLATFYGLPAAQDPQDRDEIKVAEFLRQTGVTYEELRELLSTRFLNPDDEIELRDDENPSRCDLEKTTLTNLTPQFWRRAHRFIRLRRKLGWTAHELDRAFEALQETRIRLGFLRKLGVIEQLRQQLPLPTPVLLSFWGDLDTEGPESLYRRLFLNKAVLNPPDGDFQVFRLDGSVELLANHAATVLSALRLNAADFEALVQHLGLPPAETTLSLPLLSTLHRHVALARALRLSVTDFLSLLTLTGADPFEPGNPRSTLTFVELVRVVKESGFSISQLRYLYLSETPNPSFPTEAKVHALFNTLRDGLRRITDEAQLSNPPNQVPTNEALKTALPLVLHEGVTARAEAIVEKLEPLDAADLEFIGNEFQFLEPAEKSALGLDPTPDARRARVFVGALAYLRRDFVLQTLGESLGVEDRTVAALVEKILVSQGVPGKMAIQDFLKLANLPNDLDPADVQAAVVGFRRDYLRLHKAALLVVGFGFAERELVYLHEHALDFDGALDLNGLPLEPGEFSNEQFQRWRRLARYAELAQSVPQRDATLIDVFEAAQLPAAENPREEAIARLKLATGWDSDEVDFIAGPDGLNLAAADFRNEARLISLYRRIRLSVRLGVSSAQLFRWAGAEPDAEVAAEIVNAAKAKYPDEQWLAVARPLNDRLRERRKDALIAYTLERTNLADSNYLFERFLIDVEMSACMKTSRIKQAISSVQLFIQRCLMNLEGNVRPSAIDAEQWEWMKNYRVWEANRKVFLYPENWIEPELRDDKSTIFCDLESELMQGDLDGASAEQAFLHYLEKLDRVARLEPCGLYVQAADGPDEEEVVHVFGRTVEEPRVYYYRRLINGRTWTPWEPVDLDIEGDHLMPVVHDRRLYLFWLRFEQKQNKEQQFEHGYIASEEHALWVGEHYWWRDDYKRWKKVQDVWKGLESAARALRANGIGIDLAQLRQAFIEENDENKRLDEDEPKEPSEPAFSNPPPIVHWEIKLSWGEYHRGRWTAKRTSTESVISPMVARTVRQYCDRLGFDETSRNQFIELQTMTGSEKTIAVAYLPEVHTHLVTTQVTPSGLHFLVNRLYVSHVPVLGSSFKIEGYEGLGGFSLHCGSKIKTYSVAAETTFDFGYSIDFDALSRPDDTTNYALTYRSEHDSQKLSFVEDGQTRDILSKKIAGGFSILYEHAQPQFRLSPPYQDFFYHDQEKTYYARYQAAIRDVFLHSSFTAVGGSFPRHDALANSVNRRMLPPPSNGQHRSGAKRIVVQDRSRQADEETGAVMKRAEDSSPARAGRRAGLTLTNEGQRTWGTATEGMTFTESVQNGLRFHTFFHPHICAFTERLYRSGVPGLLSRQTQLLRNEFDPGQLFEFRYGPSDEVVTPYPHEFVDFGGGAYALYNWELFFHIPMLVAVSLSKNQRFADALRWFHFIFDPTTNSPAESPGRYWNTLPFFKNSDPEKDQIRELLLTLAERGPGWKEIEDQIAEWLDNPFNPHLIARLRLTAYQKNVVMKYIDALIGWGDQLFSRDTLESINEATLLYVLAYNILGPRPKTIPKEQPDAKTYNDLEGELDAFSNALVEVENAVPNFALMAKTSWGSRARATTRSNGIRVTGAATLAGARAAGTTSRGAGDSASAGPPSVLGPGAGPTFTAVPDYTLVNPGASRPPGPSIVRSLYFCVPQNEQLLRYWDTVEDRLFKIRHCMNIEGAVRELPLFEPPIDPALLVRAVAAGLDIGSVLNDLFAPLPRYRFNFILQKAQELCGELKSLGGALLSALEKKDAEALSNLRARHETALLREIKEVRRQQVAEAKSSLEALNKTFEATQHRRTHYASLLGQGLSVEEHAHLENLQEANSAQHTAETLYLAAQHLSGMPDFVAGTSGWSSPVATFSLGGTNLGNAITSFAKFIENQAADAKQRAEMNLIVGGHRRRAEEWAFQVSSAQNEMSQISRQIVAAEIRQAIAEKELENHERQIENSEAVEEFLRGKYTNTELYGWMTAQISKVYFQTYKLASDMAKRAERAYKFELGLPDSNFVQSGYWDSLRKGLLAGEQLSLDLKRMEAAYLEQNKREYEITKHVSLLLHDPLALINLKVTGECAFTLPETLFDMDYPGHYMRRLKSVSLSIPAVTGPYTSVNCTLTLLKNETRIESTPAEPYGKNEDGDDRRFVVNFAAQQSIATSHAQNDAGVFELNFRDERYLPFEGAGATSEWQIELPAENNAFDLDTISDVVLHLKYTARDGGDILRAAAREAAILPSQENLARMFSVKHEFPTEWHRFLHPADEPNQVLKLNLIKDRFPFQFRNRRIEITKVGLFLALKDVAPMALPQIEIPLRLSQELTPGEQILLTSRPDLAGLHHGEQDFVSEIPSEWSIMIEEGDIAAALAVSVNGHQRLNPEAIADLIILCHYSVTTS